MAENDQSGEGTLERRETPEDRQKADAAEVKLWLDALRLADKEEEDWRKDADNVIKRYRGEKEYEHTRYRLLYANVQTEAPALYNSAPIPDIRRRFGDRDEDAKNISQALERCVSCQAEKADLDSVMEEMTLHRLLPGRAVTRIRHDREVMPDGYVKESISFEPIAWEDYRHGPAKRWADVPWQAFRLYLTREQLEDLIAEEVGGDTPELKKAAKLQAVALAQKIPLNATTAGARKEGDGSQPPTVFKRAEVWQIWDKDTRRIVYVCPDYKDAPVARVGDTLELEQFFPNPRPMLAMRSPDSLVPVTEYSQYAKLADDLEEMTVRLATLVRAVRARGVAAKELGPAFAAMSDLDDGQVAASDEAFALAQNGKISDAIWFWPLETIVAAIRELYLAREETKNLVYEVMGLSDILRGASNASETLGAQQIKAQWGSARLQRAQADVARFARDLFRLAVEVIATKFEPQSIMLASGVQLTPEQVQLMRRDVMREYRIDVETDSTIRADLTRHQENMGQFVQGFAALVQALGPVVQEGLMPGDVAAAILTGFARNFKLGKQAEDALERLGDQAMQQAQQGKQPKPEEIKAQAEAALMQQDMQLKAKDQQARTQKDAADLKLKEQEAMASAQTEMAKIQIDAELKREEMALKREEMALERERMMHDTMAKQDETARRMQTEDRDFELRNAESMHKRKSESIANGEVQSDQVTSLADALAPALEQIAAGMQAQAQATAKLADAVGAETELVRDPNGRAIGARKKPPQMMVN